MAPLLSLDLRSMATGQRTRQGAGQRRARAGSRRAADKLSAGCTICAASTSSCLIRWSARPRRR